ncbi:MAG: aryl-sulfate sulfotransferase [Chloroflexota bacterium]
MLIQNTGVTLHNKAAATLGYTLFAPIGGNKVNLIDLDGNIVHQWQTRGGSTNTCMLLPNGNLWVLESHPEPALIRIASSGRICEYDWDGNLVWEHLDHNQHHDARRLPNGGAVYLAWELLDNVATSKVQGGIPSTEHPEGIVGEVVREVDADGKVVWEWKTADLDFAQFPLYRNATRQCYGHTNSVEVLSDGNYLVSFKVFNMVAIIDRQTKAFKWVYQNNALGGQHDAQMLDNGNVLVFANGVYASDLQNSSVWEIDPRTNKIVWQYKQKKNAMSFYSSFISGCQRLPSGNTLICEGQMGCLFEVTPDHDIVWEYVNPKFRPNPKFGLTNWIFRARRYAPDSPEIRNRL